MNIYVLIVLILWLTLGRRLEKKYPLFFKKIELPCCILSTGMVAVYCAFPVYGVYDVLTSEVSGGDKAFFTLFIGCIIAVYGVMLAYTWKRYWKERKKL